MRMNARVSLALISAVFSTAVMADELPPRKPGGWEGVTTGEELPNVTLKLCIDKDTDQLFYKIGSEVIEKCSRKDVRVAGNVATIDSQCKLGGTAVATKMVMTFAGDTAL